jgi:hypothetical protein
VIVVSFIAFLGRWTLARLKSPWSIETCPACGHGMVEHGFGLAGGGYGSYAWCTRDRCTWFYKRQSEE